MQEWEPFPLSIDFQQPGSTDSTAVFCSHSPFTCGKPETGRSWVCASCKFKATILLVWNEPLLSSVMSSVEPACQLLAKALFSRNTAQIYQFRPGFGFVPYQRYPSDSSFPDPHPAFALPPLHQPGGTRAKWRCHPTPFQGQSWALFLLKDELMSLKRSALKKKN